MTNKKSTFERYEIVLMRFDLSHYGLHNFIILQLPFFFDRSYDKRVAFQIIVLIEKNLPNLVKNGKKNHIFNW